VWSLHRHGRHCDVLIAGDAAETDVRGRTVLLAWRNAPAVAASDMTIFDLEAKTVRGRRDGAADVIRHLLFKYQMVFEPRLWRFGARLDEQTY
jgi:hypothetical protein